MKTWPSFPIRGVSQPCTEHPARISTQAELASDVQSRLLIKIFYECYKLLGEPSRAGYEAAATTPALFSLTPCGAEQSPALSTGVSEFYSCEHKGSEIQGLQAQSPRCTLIFALLGHKSEVFAARAV